jgi:hypothetical protein
MDNLALKNSLKQTSSFSPPITEPESGEPIKTVKINFSINLSDATVDNLISYLKDFEQLPYFASIDSIGLTSVGANGWLDYSSITLSGKLYARQ